MRKPSYWNKAKVFLSKKDKVMKKLINNYKDGALITRNDVFFSLFKSIIGQQISVAAANSVFSKFEKICKGRINVKNNKYQNNNSPLDKNCDKFDLNKYSLNYLNHLFNTNEILASMILTLHNINFYQELMKSIRINIQNGTFDEFHDNYIDKL